MPVNPSERLFDALPKKVQRRIKRDFKKIARQDNNKESISKAELQSHIASELKKGVENGIVQDMEPIMFSINRAFDAVDLGENGLDIDEYTAIFVNKYMMKYSVETGYPIPLYDNFNGMNNPGMPKGGFGGFNGPYGPPMGGFGVPNGGFGVPNGGIFGSPNGMFGAPGGGCFTSPGSAIPVEPDKIPDEDCEMYPYGRIVNPDELDEASDSEGDKPQTFLM